MPSSQPETKFRGDSQPSDMTRALVTVALAVYLLGLGLSILGNTGSGSSALVRTLKNRLFSPWLVPPWLDLGFDYRLTHGDDLDADYAIEVRRYGDATTSPIRLPGTLTGERAARWRRLARSMAVATDDSDRDGLLAAAIGRSMFDAAGGQDLVVQVIRTPLPLWGGPELEPVQASSARVRMVMGDLQLIRLEPPGEVAPLIKPAEAAR